MIEISTNGELELLSEVAGVTFDTSKKYHLQITNNCNLKLTDFDEFEKPRNDFEFDASQGQDLYIRVPQGLKCNFAIVSAMDV